VISSKWWPHGSSTYTPRPPWLWLISSAAGRPRRKRYVLLLEGPHGVVEDVVGDQQRVMLARELNPWLGVIEMYAVIKVEADEWPPIAGLG
jgi:hypothetical protein